MNKDVIYIDVEDDITAIISKVKASKEKIVALVPPKRIGVLQSAVNLRLLSRAAEQGNKRLVIITSNHALMSLAASASLPVARNLQSKPELAEVAALEVDDGEDIIDGNDLPIGEHAGLPVNEGDDSSSGVAPATVAASRLAQPPKAGQVPAKPRRGKSGMSVPNFNTFRKKLLLGIGGGVVFIAFLVWAIAFAPRATIVVAAKTNDSPINTKLTAGDKLSTDLSANTIKAVKAQKSENKSVDFAATGSKNLGEKAVGTVKFSTSDATTAIQGVTIPAGTVLTDASGNKFLTDSTVSIGPSNYKGAPVGITASEQGAKYNGASGSMSGAPSMVNADITTPTSGGTDKVVRVVTADDVQKAKEALVDEESKSMQSQLKSTLKNTKIIDGSYRVDYTDLKSTPDVGAEAASSNATLSTTIVYSMYGIRQSELGKYLDSYIKKQLGASTNQRAYDNGAKKATFQDVSNGKDSSQLTLIATSKLGPKLDEAAIKQQSLGKKTGEIQENLQGIRGIEDVQVNYFPFWVTSVPGDPHKVNVQFKVNG